MDKPKGATNRQLKADKKFLQDQLIGVRLIACELEEQLESIVFSLARDEYSSPEVTWATNKMYGLVALLRSANINNIDRKKGGKKSREDNPTPTDPPVKKGG